MKGTKQQGLNSIFESTGFHLAVAAAFALLLGNIGALTDYVLHPEIPYFDEEHLVAGSVAASVGGSLLFTLRWYDRRLTAAKETIHRLEAILPICANCKKIRKNRADPVDVKSWQPIDKYISENTDMLFSHGICPECVGLLYPEHAADFQTVDAGGPVDEDSGSRAKGKSA